MNTRIEDREVLFFAQDGHIVRIVVARSKDPQAGATGGQKQERTYTHRCAKEAFEKVAHAIAETPTQGTGTSLHDLAQHEALPFTQVNVAMEFLKARGLVDVRHRRCYPGTADVYLDAMIEYHALAHSGGFV